MNNHRNKESPVINSPFDKNITNIRIYNFSLYRLKFIIKRLSYNLKRYFYNHSMKSILYKRLFYSTRTLLLSTSHELEKQKIENKFLKEKVIFFEQYTQKIYLFNFIFSNIKNILNPFLFIDSNSYSIFSKYTEEDILNAKKSVVSKNVLERINIIKSSVDNNYISSTNDVKDICNVGRNTINSYFKKIYLSNIDDPKYLLYCKTKNGRGHPFYLVKNLSLEFLTFLLFLSSYFNKPIFLLIDYIYSFNDIGHSNKCINS